MKFVFWCSNEQRQFRLAELDAIIHMLGFQAEWLVRSSSLPWVALNLSTEEEAKAILERSVSVKFGLEVWAEGDNNELFHQNLKEFPFGENEKLFGEDVKFKIQVEVFNKKLANEEKISRIEMLMDPSGGALPFKGAVSLNSPDVTLYYLEFWGLDQNKEPEHPEQILLGRKIGDGRRESIRKLSIKTRKFIGNTTMDPELSLLMANLAQVSRGSLVLDPFVGTASLLIAAAEFGGLVLGADIDYLTLHARSRPSRVGQKVRAVDENMAANFHQYGLASRYLGVVAGDSSRPPWRDGAWLDCIITDPPYGIRETTYKVGTEKDLSHLDTSLKEQFAEKHIPEKVSYSLYHLLVDLLQFAASHLREGGRLVYWLPVIRQIYSSDLTPSHPCLRLVEDCEQVLSSHSSRRLIVMERNSGEVDGSVAVVDPRLGEFKEQFMLPVGSVIPKKERQARVKKHGHLNLTEEELAKIKAGKAEKLQRMAERNTELML